MDVRRQFRTAADKLLLDFESTKDAVHAGGKGTNRENLVRDYLSRLLPAKYAMGAGEVVSTDARRSQQLDVVIYDGSRAPRLLLDPEHALYPLESVFGALQVKSRLDASELRDAYKNIGSLKSLVSKRGFSMFPNPSMSIGMAPAMPVCMVVAFTAGRSLEAVRDQVVELDQASKDLRLRPDAIVLLGGGPGEQAGIIGPRQRWRGAHNGLSKMSDGDLQKLSRTGKNTWLRFYLSLLAELDAVHLPPLDLEAYLRMPDVIDGHRVTGHDRLIRHSANAADDKRVFKIGASGVQRILAHCAGNAPISRLEALRLQLGHSTQLSHLSGLDDMVHVFNPNNLPPLDIAKAIRTHEAGSGFHPIWINIDDVGYGVDLTALELNDMEPLNDVEVDELFY